MVGFYCHTLGWSVDEELHRQLAAADGVDDFGHISAVTFADPAGADLDDGKFPGRGIALPEKVHAEADVLVRVLPAAFAEMVANNHVQVSRLVEFETEHGAELEWLVVLDLPGEWQANAINLAEFAVHADNDICFVCSAEDVSLDEI